MGMGNTIKRSIFLGSVFLLLSNVGLQAQIVVVVNRDNPIDSLRLSELRQIYRAVESRWEYEQQDRTDIMLLDYRRKSKLVDSFYKQVVGLSRMRIRLLWVGKLLEGELDVLPIAVASETEMLKRISQNTGAIGFVSLAQFNSSGTLVKSIKIDGKEFKNKEYPIR